MPFGGADGDITAGDTPSDSSPVAAPRPSPPPVTSSPSGTSPSPTTTVSRTRTGGDKKPDPEPQGTSSSAAGGGGGSTVKEAATCTVGYDLVNEWPDGFQATVTVTTTRALTNWSVGWSFKDGQQVGQMWDASVAQTGSRVTATAADYNKAVPAHGTLSFGFLASWKTKNSPPYDFTLNGQPCGKTG
jgi:cellulase/cellobiase CelA1